MKSIKEQNYHSWDRVYRQYDHSQLPWVSTVPNPVLVDALSLCPIKTGHALEIGCGLGQNARYLSRLGFDITAIDISDTALKCAQKESYEPHSVDYRCENFLDSNINCKFDLILDFFHFHDIHPKHRSLYLNKISSLLAPSACIIIAFLSTGFFNHNKDYSRKSLFFDGIVTHSNSDIVCSLFDKVASPISKSKFQIIKSDFSSDAEIVVLHTKTFKGLNDET